MKVAIISPCILPVPAVKGGAVLTLIESLIKQNEIYKDMNLTIVGSYDQEAEKISRKYKNSKFIFLHEQFAFRKIDYCIDKIVGLRNKNEQEHHYLWKLKVIAKVKKILIENNFDKVVFQNSGYLLEVLKDKNIVDKYKNRLYYHLHNDIPDNVYINGVKQCQLIVISKYISEKVKKICGDEIEKQIHVVKNGLQTELFLKSMTNIERNYLKKKLGITTNKKIIIYAGRITEYKGIRELFKAFMQLNNDEYTLLIVGSFNFGTSQTSSFEIELNNMIKSCKQQVICTGFVPYEQMWKYYQISNVAVLPSMWNEPAGLTMIEAALSGVPVITTNSGGIPEYLNEKNSIFVNRDNNIIDELAKSIEKVLNNLEIWDKKAEKAKLYVKDNFSESVFYSNFCEILKQF